ncbi:MAG: heme-binding domain-containing protein [Thermoleophilia bacterium]
MSGTPSGPKPPRSRRRPLKRIVLAGAALFVVAQLVPYGRDHSNPATRVEPKWDSARTRELAVGACFDCHSNQVNWPWYSHVAPVSWLVQSDVDGARNNLNFQEWNRPQETDEIAEAIDSGEMPPLQYRLMHSSGRLSSAQRDQLVAGIRATLAASPPGR